MMLHIPGLLSRGDAERLRDAVEAASWVDGRATVGAQGALVKRNRQLSAHDPMAQALGQGVLEAVRRSPLFMSAALPVRFSDPLFNRYEGGETYGLHVDGAVRLSEGGPSVRTDLSCTLFLTDPDTYDGGDLQVVDTYGVHEVKLPAGDAILYPSSSLHQVTPVTRGVRLASFFWMQSMIREDSRRTLLFDMDRSIQALRSRHGDEQELLSLTGNYHNLLRMWAET